MKLDTPRSRYTITRIAGRVFKKICYKKYAKYVEDKQTPAVLLI